LISVVLLAIFVGITRSIHRERGRLAHLDIRVARAMEDHAREHPELLHVLRGVTRAGGVLGLICLTLAGAVALFRRRYRLLAVVWIMAASGGALLDLTLKVAIHRQRPRNPDAAVSETNESFPSGHAMGSVVGYGLLGYVLCRYFRRRRARAAVITGLALLVMLIGFSRVYLRAHYLSDVLGGFAIGAVWLAVCLSGLETVRRRKIHVHRQQSEPAPEALVPPSERQLSSP
jgi:undecaprenyl-diphosphatase